MKIVFFGMIAMFSTSITMSTTMDESENDQEPEGSNYNETQFEIFLEELNQRAMVEYQYSIEKSWNYNTNITEYNKQQMVC